MHTSPYIVNHVVKFRKRANERTNKRKSMHKLKCAYIVRPHIHTPHEI